MSSSFRNVIDIVEFLYEVYVWIILEELIFIMVSKDKCLKRDLNRSVRIYSV